MNSSRIIVATLLACAGLGASASNGQALPATQTVAPSRHVVVAVPRSPEASYAYLTEDAPSAQAVMARSDAQKVAVGDAGKPRDETNALAVCAVGLLIAGFTILRRIH